MADISGDTRGESDIVEPELAHTWVELEKERQWLSDTTSGTEDDDFRSLEPGSTVSIQCHIDAMLCPPKTQPRTKKLRILTLLAVAEKARRLSAPPRTWDALRAANIVTVGRDEIKTKMSLVVLFTVAMAVWKGGGSGPMESLTCWSLDHVDLSACSLHSQTSSVSP